MPLEFPRAGTRATNPAPARPGSGWPDAFILLLDRCTPAPRLAGGAHRTPPATAPVYACNTPVLVQTLYTVAAARSHLTVRGATAAVTPFVQESVGQRKN
jgi:hypothetical protein